MPANGELVRFAERYSPSVGERVTLHQVPEVVEVVLELSLGGSDEDRSGQFEEAAGLRIDDLVDACRRTPTRR